MMMDPEVAARLLTRALDALKKAPRVVHTCFDRGADEPCTCGADAAHAERAAVVAEIEKGLG